MKQAMIFAAGLGTRLRPLTDDRPKALVEVCGRPLIDHVIQRLTVAGFERIVVNVHHFAKMIIEHIASLKRDNVEILISDESDLLLETGGGLRKAAPLFDACSNVLIHNVDIFSNVDLSELYQHATDTPATLLVSNRDTSRYLLFDDDMRLVGWTNVKTGEVRTPYDKLDVERCSRFAFSGIHVLSPALLEMMQQWPERFGIIDFYLSICQDVEIKGFIKSDLRLIDVGKMESLAQAEQFLKTI